jgi:hypothetical protein
VEQLYIAMMNDIDTKSSWIIYCKNIIYAIMSFNWLFKITRIRYWTMIF